MDEKTRIVRAVSAALGADVDVDVGDSPDGTWRLGVAGLPRQPRFRALWLRQGWPADVRSAFERSPDVTLAVAPAFSAGARRLLEERRVSWVDESGSANVRADGLLVRVDRGAAPADPAPLRARWSAAAVLAAEAVLVLRPERLTTSWVAERAGCSVARASGILKGWDAAGWTRKRGPARGPGAHRTLEERDHLLGSWTDHLNAKPVERWYAHSTSGDMNALQRRLCTALDGRSWAWTGWAAAEHLASFVTQLPVLHLRLSEAYARRDIEPALREAGVTLTEDAGRVELWRTPVDAFRHTTASDAGPVQSWPRVFADLERLGGRGQDAAEHLRDVTHEVTGDE